MNETIESQKLQDIVRTANREELGRANTLTFLFLLGYGSNIIKETQQELSADSGVDPRTLRSHLYRLAEGGWIEYSGTATHNDSKNIILKRFKH